MTSLQNFLFLIRSVSNCIKIIICETGLDAANPETILKNNHLEGQL